MYCSSCGAEVAAGLIYCNRCGANLAPSESIEVISRPKGTVAAIVIGFVMLTGLALGGLAMVFAFVREFIGIGIPVEGAVFLAICGLLMLFGIAFILSRQLSRLTGSYLESGESTEKPKKSKLSAKKPLEIADAPPIQPARSVTDSTTRTLDPVYRENKN